VVPLTTTAIAARLGPVALGGQQIAMRVWYLLALLPDALAVPAQVYVSSCLGAGDQAGARRVGRRSLRLGLVTGIGLGVDVCVRWSRVLRRNAGRRHQSAARP
jgi:Na+-driven multidrug efflux pump